MNPDKTTELEDAISFGHVAPDAEEEQEDEDETPEPVGQGDRDPEAQGISNRPGDMDHEKGIDPEPGNNA